LRVAQKYVAQTWKNWLYLFKMDKILTRALAISDIVTFENHGKLHTKAEISAQNKAQFK